MADEQDNTVFDAFKLRCPECDSDGDLQISFKGLCRLTPDGSEDIGNHEFDEHSSCTCGDCGYGRTVKAFQVEE